LKTHPCCSNMVSIKIAAVVAMALCAAQALGSIRRDLELEIDASHKRGSKKVDKATANRTTKTNTSQMPMIDMFAPPPMGAGSAFAATESPYENPKTYTKLIKEIPTQENCQIREQTMMEVHHMRTTQEQLAHRIAQEMTFMSQRKSYVEAMTNYLNERIGQLNKVKSELDSEKKWVDVSNHRVAELAQKVKLVKLQDVLACLTAGKNKLDDKGKDKANAIHDLTNQMSGITKNLQTIKNNIQEVFKSKSTAASFLLLQEDVMVASSAQSADDPSDAVTDALPTPPGLVSPVEATYVPEPSDAVADALPPPPMLVSGIHMEVSSKSSNQEYMANISDFGDYMGNMDDVTTPPTIVNFVDVEVSHHHKADYMATTSDKAITTKDDNEVLGDYMGDVKNEYMAGTWDSTPVRIEPDGTVI